MAKERAAATQPTMATLNSQRLRKEAGEWLKARRQAAALSQMDLSTGLGLKYYTFVSQVENGFGRVPSESMERWAQLLGVDPAVFARTLLAYYDPALHRALFGEAAHDAR